MIRFPALLALVLLPAPLFASDDEKLTLAREIAGYSLLHVIGPLQSGAEVDQLLADEPDLTAEEQARLRNIGREKAAELGQRALEAEAQVLAESLSLEELQAIAAYERSPEAAKRRSVAPAMIGAVMHALDGTDYQGEVRRAFCEETGKLCQ